MYNRIGSYIGTIRNHEGITLEQLSQGLCSPAYLNRIEQGTREADKLMTDAFLQRLGKSTDQFEYILDFVEYRLWQQRNRILCNLISGERNKDAIERMIETYRGDSKGVLHEQFAEVAELNLYRQCAVPLRELHKKMLRTLRMTQPDYGEVPLGKLFLSKIDCYLVLRSLELEEEINGDRIIGERYQELSSYLKQPRFISKEQIHVLPIVACHVAEYKYTSGACMETDAECSYLLWIPFEERGNVYSSSRLIRERRKMMNLSQEELSHGICSPVTLSRIENERSIPQKKLRQLLLQRLNFSGERFNFVNIT